jgi:pre-mRNA-processing factor 40
MDKEDALMIFQQHIRAAEEQYQKDKAAESKRNKRQERKIREQFMQFLQELYVRGLLTPFSSWSSLFPIISADERFDNMLSQTGIL